MHTHLNVGLLLRSMSHELGGPNNAYGPNFQTQDGPKIEDWFLKALWKIIFLTEDRRDLVGK